MSDSGEVELIKGCLAGDRRYQELLYVKFCRKMLGICNRYTGSKEEAEDLLQDAFIKVFNQLERFRFEGSLEGWIRRIVINTIIDHFRKKSVMVVLTDYETYTESPADLDFVSNADFQELLNAIRELSPGYRTVFNMFAVEGYSHKEISEALGISTGTSKSQYSAARRILQKKLKVHSVNNSFNSK
jgi:RNA polymerase sigma-70 factor (ECF subfamily)